MYITVDDVDILNVTIKSHCNIYTNIKADYTI